MSNVKVSKMRGIVKKWQKLARVGRVYTSTLDTHSKDIRSLDNSDGYDAEELTSVPEGFEVVYAGKSKRRFVINGQHLKHPLFKVLQERSEQCGVDQSLGVTLGCEVVLFEHLLWLLDSDDPSISQVDSVRELAEFYMPSDEAALLRFLKSQE